MKFDRILFGQAKYDSAFSNVLPAGIGYLSEFLSSKGIENGIFDLNIRKNTEEKLLYQIEQFKPDLIGFSMMSLNYRYNYDVINRLRHLFPETKIVVGGAHLSTMREEVLKTCKGIDYGVVMEGEHTLFELMNGEKKISEIKGLIYRDGDKVVYNGDRPFIQDLDSLPYPRYEKFNKNYYSSLISVFSSRGCPFECTYCPVTLAIGRRFTARSPKHVASEIEFHYNRGYTEFSFRDDNFTLVQDRVYEICDEIEKRNLKGLYLMCDNGVRADKLSYNLLKRMREVGFKMIGLGVEAGSDRILKNIKKNETIKDIENAIKIACDLGYMVEIYFLIGSPGETWDDFQDSIRLAVRYPVMLVRFYHILPYPNTELYEFVKKNNYLVRSPEEYLNDGSQRRNTPFFATPEFPFELRKKAFVYAYKIVIPHIRKAQKEYSMRNSFRKLTLLGLDPLIAKSLAYIYSTELVREGIFKNPVFAAIRDMLKKRVREGG